MRRWTVPVFLLLGGTLLAGQQLVAPGPLRGWLYQAVLWASLLAILVGVRRHRPAHPRAWVLLATGVGVLGIAAASDPRFWAAAPTSSPAVVTLAGPLGYLLVGLGALGFARAQSGGRDRGPALDSVLVTLALTTVLWEAALARHPSVAGDPVFLPRILLNSAGASWVAAMTTRVVLSGGHRTLSGWLLLASSLLGCAGAAIWSWQWVLGGLPSRLTVGAWSAALLLLGAAALHSSMRRLTTAVEGEGGHTVSRVVLPALALLVGPAAMVIRQLADDDSPTVAAYATLLIGIVVVLRFADLVADRERALRELHHLTLHDPLTGLPNRTLLRQQLTRALRQQRPAAGNVGVCFIDLDRFKAINDAHGHAAGDQALAMVADRLQQECLPDLTLARFAGDEFVVVAPDRDPASLMALAARLRQATGVPIELPDGTSVTVDASVGVVLAAGLADADGVLNAADKAMHVAKRQTQAAQTSATPPAVTEVGVPLR